MTKSSKLFDERVKSIVKGKILFGIIDVLNDAISYLRPPEFIMPRYIYPMNKLL